MAADNGIHEFLNAEARNVTLEVSSVHLPSCAFLGRDIKQGKGRFCRVMHVLVLPGIAAYPDAIR